MSATARFGPSGGKYSSRVSQPDRGQPHVSFSVDDFTHAPHLNGNGGAALGAAARKFSPTAAAIVAANCDVVTVRFSRTPSGGTSGPSAAIHVASAAGTFRPWSVQSVVVAPRPWSVVTRSVVRFL